MKSKQLLLVEGSDMCGKTFICELMKEIIEVDKTIKDTSYKYFKFPQYDQTFGNSIMDHLVHFNPKSKHMFEEREKISNELIINKIDSLNKILDEINKSSEQNTITVFDRFTMSQLVYDLAWVTNPKFRKHIDVSDYYNIKNRYADIVYNLYKKSLPEGTEISSIYCKSSIYIKCISSVEKGLRRIDSYDKNKLYQDTVKILFTMLYEGLSPSQIEERIRISDLSKHEVSAHSIREIYHERRFSHSGRPYSERDVYVMYPDVEYSNIYKSLGCDDMSRAILSKNENYIVRFLTDPLNKDIIDVAKDKYISNTKEFLTGIITRS